MPVDYIVFKEEKTLEHYLCTYIHVHKYCIHNYIETGEIRDFMQANSF